MRQIKFRGKRYGDGDWVYGNLYQGITDGEQYSIILDDAGYHVAPQDDRNLAIAFAENEVNVVFTQTVGQFTGLLDKNGNEIYEGDIILFYAPDEDSSKFGQHKGVVEWMDGTTLINVDYFNNVCRQYYPTFYVNFFKRCEVLGNIHDNPEILKNE